MHLSHILCSLKKEKQTTLLFSVSIFTCPGEQTISREVGYDLKPYDFQIHLRNPGCQPILFEAAINLNLPCGYNTGARF